MMHVWTKNVKLSSFCYQGVHKIDIQFTIVLLHVLSILALFPSYLLCRLPSSVGFYLDSEVLWIYHNTAISVSWLYMNKSTGQ